MSTIRSIEKSQMSFASPVGWITVIVVQAKLEQILLNKKMSEIILSQADKKTLTNAKQQLNEYFLGKRKVFTVPLTETVGTPFQQKTWRALQTIPYGTSLSYQELAERIKHSKAYRAVGNANGKNPLPIIIPCHRVVAKNGLGGYSGGIKIKKFLQALEQAQV